VAALFSATAGVIFLGTPHRGGNKLAWSRIVQNLVEAVLHDHTERVLEALMRGSEVLERLQDSFCGIIQDFSVYSFFEDLPVTGVGKVRSSFSYFRSSRS
jgi:hypothetical protein